MYAKFLLLPAILCSRRAIENIRELEVGVIFPAGESLVHPWFSHWGKSPQ